jgi:RNA polymerase sigma factor (sigma-70 family)
MSEDSAMTKLAVISAGTNAAQRFDSLVRPHYDTLFRVAYRFTGSRHDAEDLVQETCTRAWRHLDRIAGLEDPRGWLICVMRRLFIDQTRSYERANVSHFEDGDEDVFASGERGPAEHTESELIARRVARSWRKLGREQRTLLALHDVEGYSLSELEEFTGLKIGTIKSRLHRARIRLGRLLESDGGTDAMNATLRADS